MFETLEDRRHFSAAPTAFQDAFGIVYVVGTTGGDTITANEAAVGTAVTDPHGNPIAAPKGLVNISAAGPDGAVTLNKDFFNVKAVVIDAGAGDDNVTTYEYSVPVIVFGGKGNDTILATDDTSEGTPGSTLIFGNEGDDNITVWNGNNAIVDGGDGNDTLQVFAGSATLLGGNGDDEFAVLNANFTGAADSPVTVVLADGGNGNDTLVSSIGTQVTFLGGNGNDTLIYFGGAVSFYGGNGNDTAEIYQTFPDIEPNASVAFNGGNGKDSLQVDSSTTPIPTTTTSVESVSTGTLPPPTI